MNNIESILYFAAVAICGFCFVLLVLCRRYIKRFPPFLILLIALLCLGFVLQILVHAPQSYWKHLWMFLAIAHSFIFAPCVWLYAQSTKGQEVSIRALGGIKIWLVGTGILLASPLLFLVYNGPGWVGPSHPDSSLFWQIYYVLAGGYVVIYFGQALWYLHLSLPYLSVGAESSCGILHLLRSSISESTTQLVLRLVLLGFLASLFINAVRVVHCALIGYATIVSPLISLLDIAISVAVLLSVLAKMIRSVAIGGGEDVSHAKQKVADKYKRSALDEQMRSRIKAKVEDAMRNPQVFTRNSLTLPNLASAIGEKHHYVSQVVNQDLSTTFLDLVNRARIRHAQRLIAENTELAIIDLTEIVGFNSKTTFYTAFAKYVGTTPAKYRRSLNF